MAAIVVPVLLLLTAACGGSDDTTEDTTKVGTLADVQVQRHGAGAPTVVFKAPVRFEQTQSKVVKAGPGKGEAVKASSNVTVNYVGINASDSDEYVSTWSKKGAATPQSFPLNTGVIKGLGIGLAGSHAGDEVLITVASKDGYDPSGYGASIRKGDSLIFVVDVLKVSTPLKTAKGTKQSAPASVPTLVFDDKGQPEKFKATASTPKKVAALASYPIIKGNGPVVTKGQTITVEYVGQLYPDGKVFDESWSRPDPVSFQIGVGAVIPGWDKTLVGQTVGSRVILVIPSVDGYGKAGQPPTIGKNADLIFVVDILGAS